MKTYIVSTAAALCLLVAGVSYASPVTFFRQDQNPNHGTNAPNSDNAYTQFLSNLSSGVGTENFEGFTPGQTAPFAISFPGSSGSITANLTGSDAKIYSGPDGVGRVPISGSQYLEGSQDFNVAFSAPISAFGFYATDIGDFGGQIVLTLTGGSTITITIPSLNPSSDGNELLFGFYDLTDSYTNIAFGDMEAGTEVFGFDDMTIGDLRQITPNPVPEPGSLAMFGFGFGLLGLMLVQRRRRYNS